MKYPSLLDRFKQYVQIDTQSDASSPTVPSTAKQKNLGQLLVQQLLEMGVEDAHMDDKGYVYATVPASAGAEDKPAVCFCAHMDTSPEYSGAGVIPTLHEDYDGGEIHLPKGGIVLTPKQFGPLKEMKGHTIITSDGSTLLGADNKAGVAEIMTAAELLMKSDRPHAAMKILFTPDEEIGRGADHVDLEKLGADFGYTMDGATKGSLEDETFSADGATIIFRGANTHPGYAHKKMGNALKAAGVFLGSLPRSEWAPESTKGEAGFVHPYEITGGVEEVRITMILRSFDTEDLEPYAALLNTLAKQASKAVKRTSYEVIISEQYRNMKEVLDKHPHVVEYAEKAISAAGLPVRKSKIRGGTDGSKLSFMGLPCPNIFAGEHAFHSPYEFVSLQDMESATDVIVNLLEIVAVES
ncbi:MAG: peptidase T [Bacteroidetes bacterium]|nr:MAG: peptidase T [Bacteroidota bacterium]REK59219.1 MAG: peptidase T [Bacteroidota bacterium]